MEKNIETYLAEIGNQVMLSEVGDLNRFEERFFELKRCYGDVVGMRKGFVELCPNQNPPDFQTELLPWLWLIQPQLKDAILKIADRKLVEMICEYEGQY